MNTVILNMTIVMTIEDLKVGLFLSGLASTNSGYRPEVISPPSTYRHSHILSLAPLRIPEHPSSRACEGKHGVGRGSLMSWARARWVSDSLGMWEPLQVGLQRWLSSTGGDLSSAWFV